MVNAVIISLLAGAIGTSLAEYFLKYNLVDEIVDVFRSTEAKAKVLEQRAQSAVKAFESATKQKFDALRKAL